MSDTSMKAENSSDPAADTIHESPERFKKLRETPRAKKPLMQKIKEAKTATKVALVTLGTLAILTSLGAIDYVAVPAFCQIVDQQLQRIGIFVPSTFDNAEKIQKIDPSNMEIITPSQAEQQNLLTPKVTVDKKANTVTLTMLFTTTSANEPPLNTILDKNNYLRDSLMPPEDIGNRFAQEHYEVPVNFPIILPKGVHYALITGEPGNDHGDSPSEILGFFYDESSQTILMFRYYNKKQIPFKSDPKSLDWDTYKEITGQKLENWKDLPISNGVTPITITTQKQTLDIEVLYPNVVELAVIPYIKIVHPTNDGNLIALSP
jgi:hypothetical protein